MSAGRRACRSGRLVSAFGDGDAHELDAAEVVTKAQSPAVQTPRSLVILLLRELSSGRHRRHRGRAFASRKPVVVAPVAAPGMVTGSGSSCSTDNASARSSTACSMPHGESHGACWPCAAGPGVGMAAVLEYAVEVASDFRISRTVGVEGEMELDDAVRQQLCNP